MNLHTAIRKQIANAEKEQGLLAKRQTAKPEKNIEEKIGEALEGRFGTLEIRGGAILYYQGSRT